MLAVTIVLAVLLAVSLAVIARRERERRRALATLGGGPDLAAAARAAMAGRSDRAQLDATVPAIRDLRSTLLRTNARRAGLARRAQGAEPQFM